MEPTLATDAPLRQIHPAYRAVSLSWPAWLPYKQPLIKSHRSARETYLAAETRPRPEPCKQEINNLVLVTHAKTSVLNIVIRVRQDCHEHCDQNPTDEHNIGEEKERTNYGIGYEQFSKLTLPQYHAAKRHHC